MPILTIYFPGQPPEDHSLHEEVVTIGRMTGNAIQLAHGSVSQSHARIMRVGSNYFLKDLKSTNGTLVNGQVIKELQLGDGDQLKLGDVTAIFRLQGGQAPVPASAVPAPIPAPAPPLPTASDLEKADTTILSSKAKTSLMRRPPTPVVEVNAPAPLPPKKKSSTALLLSVFGGVAAAAIVGFLAWKFAGGDEAKSVAAAPATSRPPPVKNSPATNVSVQPVEATPDVALPATNQQASTPTVVATNVVAQQEDQRLAELLAILRKPDLKERRHAAREISGMGTRASNVVLHLRLALVQDSDPEVRAWLVAALVSNEVYDQASIPVLMEGLKSDDEAVRKRACETLALIPNAASEPAVITQLKAATEDENDEVRKTAADALKAIAPDGADK